jgi:hypothetical protein
VQPFTRTSGEQDYEDVVQRHVRSPIIVFRRGACATESQLLRAFSGLSFD